MATSVNAGFDVLLERLALTNLQKATAAAHIKSITSFFENNFVLAPDRAFYTGSFRRGTMVRWTRDVDIMSVLSVAEYDDMYGS